MLRSYIGVHNKLAAERGSARSQACVRCGKPAREWAYVNDSPDEIVDRQGRKFSPNLDDYQPMCFGCHRRFDKAVITHCPKGHEYAGENLILDQSKRKCRTCVYARNARRRKERGTTREQQDRINELQCIRRAVKRAEAASSTEFIGRQLMAHITSIENTEREAA